jgi:hypothetical protein
MQHGVAISEIFKRHGIAHPGITTVKVEMKRKLKKGARIAL